MPRHRSGELLHMPLPGLTAWGRKHPEAQKIATSTLNKLLGGVQTVALWARDKGIIPEDRPWSDAFSRMRLREDPSDRDAFTVDELNTLFAAPVFTSGERPEAGGGRLLSGSRCSLCTAVLDARSWQDYVLMMFMR